MKTIKRQEEISFNAISFKDAIILLPLMDALVEMINQNRASSLWLSLSREDKEKYRKAYSSNTLYIQENQAETIFKILSDLGFESAQNLKEFTLNDLELK